MRLSSILSVAALSLAAAIASPAAAAPLGAGTAKAATPAGSVAEKFHWRPYRHCHRCRYGRRYCHGGRSYRRQRRAVDADRVALRATSRSLHV